MALYWVKYLFFYIGGWALLQMFNANYPGFTSPLASCCASRSET